MRKLTIKSLINRSSMPAQSYILLLTWGQEVFEFANTPDPVVKPLYMFKNSSLSNLRAKWLARKRYMGEGNLLNTYIWLPRGNSLYFLGTIHSIPFFFWSPYFSSWLFLTLILLFVSQTLVCSRSAANLYSVLLIIWNGMKNWSV